MDIMIMIIGGSLIDIHSFIHYHTPNSPTIGARRSETGTNVVTLQSAEKAK